MTNEIDTAGMENGDCAWTNFFKVVEQRAPGAVGDWSLYRMDVDKDYFDGTITTDWVLIGSFGTQETATEYATSRGWEKGATL
jgi:hypothetical protein